MSEYKFEKTMKRTKFYIFIFAIFTLIVFIIMMITKYQISGGDLLGYKLLDEYFFGYNSSSVHQVFGGLNERQMQKLLFFSQTLDSIFPIAYGGLLNFIFIYLFKKIKVRFYSFYLLLIIPSIVIILDFFENKNIAKMATMYPEINLERVAFGSQVTQVKWAMLLVTVLSIISLYLYSKRIERNG